LRLRNFLPDNPDAAASSTVIDATGYENITVEFAWQSLGAMTPDDDLHLSWATAPAPALTDEEAWTQVFQGSTESINTGAPDIYMETVSRTGAEDKTFNLKLWADVSFFNEGYVSTTSRSPITRCRSPTCARAPACRCFWAVWPPSASELCPNVGDGENAHTPDAGRYPRCAKTAPSRPEGSAYLLRGVSRVRLGVKGLPFDAGLNLLPTYPAVRPVNPSPKAESVHKRCTRGVWEAHGRHPPPNP
jgi:hypothetical protein